MKNLRNFVLLAGLIFTIAACDKAPNSPENSTEDPVTPQTPAWTISPAGPSSQAYSNGVRAVVAHQSDEYWVLASWIVSSPNNQFVTDPRNGRRVRFGKNQSTQATEVKVELLGLWEVSTVDSLLEDGEQKLYLTFAWARHGSLNLSGPSAPNDIMSLDPAGMNAVAYATGTGASPKGWHDGTTSFIDWQGWSLLHLTTTVNGTTYHWGKTDEAITYPMVINVPVGSKWRIKAIETLPTSWGGLDLKVHFAF